MGKSELRISGDSKYAPMQFPRVASLNAYTVSPSFPAVCIESTEERSRCRGELRKYVPLEEKLSLLCAVVNVRKRCPESSVN